MRFHGRPAACGVAPGRVELLGNHTDYNAGCVLSAAIDRHVVAVGRTRRDDVVRVFSSEFDTTVVFDLGCLRERGDGDWGAYVHAVFAGLRSAGMDVRGADLFLHSDLPIGAGLSSSAALECAVAMLVLQLYPHRIDSGTLARLLQRCECDYVGTRCGLLDQFASLHGCADAAILLDCASEQHEVLPLGANAPTMVICDSKVHRQLGNDTPYNDRRSECEAACRRLSRVLRRPLAGLCEVSSDELCDVASHLPESLVSRAQHVIGEHERVIAAREHLRTGDSHRLGELMVESHASSRDRFENSCAELDRLCEIAAKQSGFLGGRLCGAGWGGCTVNLVATEAVDPFIAGMRDAVGEETQAPTAELFVCHASEGARGHQVH